MFITYDFEVFKHDWLVVFKPYDGEHIVFINDYEGVKKYFQDNKKSVFVGYNNKHYDDNILKGILSDINPKKISDWIVVQKKFGWLFPGLQKIYFNSLDMMVDIPSGTGLSLKEVECNLGLAIIESDIDFDIDRALTDEELEETVKYCKYDVDCTEKLIEIRGEYIRGKLQIINSFSLPLSSICKTNAQLAAEVLKPTKLDFYDEMIYDMPNNIKIRDKSILSIYKSPINYDDSLEVNIAGVPHKLGFGGLHGSLNNYISQGNIIHLDVNSYYPAMIIKYNFLSRRVKDTSKYEEIFNQRIAWKKEKDIREGAFKLILNSTYGAMKYMYNPLYDPKQCNQICISGQLFLIDLIEKLEPYCKLLESNTDGLIIESYNDSKVEEIVKEWEDRTKFTLGKKHIKKIWKKDVNNYLWLEESGKIKAIGGYVKNFDGGNYISNSASIIDTAIANYFIHNIPTRETILNCKDAIRFQITTKKGPTYTRVEHLINNKYIKLQNVNRVFASTDTSLGRLYKITERGTKELIADLPDNCIVFNEDISTFDMKNVDKEWYITRANSKIKDFIGG